MEIRVELENGLLADRFGKFAPEEYMTDGHPTRSFPIEISGVPAEAKSLALTFLDWDAIPAGGFCWIHWTAVNIPPTITFIPENASAEESVPMVQGLNSDWSPFAGGNTNPAVTTRYAGPQPPNGLHEYTLTVMALDCELDLQEGFYLNELRRAVRGHIIEKAELELPSRAS